jgi:hypothetical protein
VTKLCFGCKELREIAYADPVDRGYCAECVQSINFGSVARAMQFLSLTIPFAVGDRVQAYTGGELYDGVGTVTEIFFDLEHGGTPVYPSFRVVIDEPADENAPDEALYTEICLKKVAEMETAQ